MNLLYREWGGDEATDNVLDRFAMLSRHAAAKFACADDLHAPGCGHDH